MENIGKEELKNLKSFFNNNKKTNNYDEEIKGEKNIENNIKRIERREKFSENEKMLRDKYLKKYTKKEIFIRSFTLGKKNMFIKICQYICNIIIEIIKFKETYYNSEIIKILSNKQFEFFYQLIIPYFIIIILHEIIYEIDFYLNMKLKDVSKQNVLLENLLKKDMEFYDVFKTGELCDKANYYGSYPYYDVVGEVINFIKNIITFIYSGYYLYKHFCLMAIISTSFFFLKLFVNPYINNAIDLNEFEERFNLKNDILNEIFSNIRLIKSFGTEKKELQKLYTVSSKIRKDMCFFYLLKNMSGHLSVANGMIIYFLLGKKCIIGELEYGDLITFNKYITEFTNSLNFLTNTITSTLYGILEWKKFLELYDIEPKIISKKDAIVPEKDKNEKNNENKKGKGFNIEFKNVSFAYPTKKDAQIFNNLSFQIPSGKTVAFVGYSGSGKTTITSLIQRFYEVNDGEIKINSINIKDLDLNWLRKNISVVSQEPILNSGSIKDNILYGVDNYSEEFFNSVCRLSMVDTFVENKKIFPDGYGTICGERGAVLSGGQKQRIAIARAIMKNAKIMIFDEATSALDSESESIVQKSIDNIVKNNNITTIIIAHRLSTIKKADCIYVLNKGEICEFGTHKELIEKNGIYKNLINNQIDI